MMKNSLFKYCYRKDDDFPHIHYYDIKLIEDIGDYKKGDSIAGATIDYEGGVVEFFEKDTHEPIAFFKLKPLEIEE